jgi:hypothetical protein
MIKFAIRKRFELKPDVTRDMVVEELRQRIDQSCSRKKFAVGKQQIDFIGQSESIWENFSATVKIKLDVIDNVLICEMDGDISLGSSESGCGWLMIILVLASLLGGLLSAVGCVIVFIISQIVLFLTSQNKPKQFLNDALAAIEFEYGVVTTKDGKKDHAAK